jgi:predicted helicase
LLPEYQKGWSVKDIFPVNNAGIITARDSLTIQNSPEQVWKTVIDFVNLPVEVARKKYQLGDDTRDWKIQLAQQDLKVSKIDKSKIQPLLYRIFDVRYTFYTGNCRGFISMPRGEIMRHMIADISNLGLITVRQVAEGIFNHVYVTNSLVECRVTLSNKGYGLLFPLYLYPQTQAEKDMGMVRRPNLSPEFLKDITSKLGYTPTPETIFYYIYAIFHSPTYRTRYAEFLKIDFPRVPLTSNNQLFTQLSEYGEELVALHLMKSPKLFPSPSQREGLGVRFVENNGNCIVDAGHPKYTNSAVIINKKGDKFTGVPESVWNFYVGGYQVCQKWLKDRKGRQLTDDDIQHYQRIVVALQETIRLMDKIDIAIPEFPIA